MTRVRYVGRIPPDNPLRGKEGIVLVRSRGPGPRNELVLLDDGTLVNAPWGCWRRVK